MPSGRIPPPFSAVTVAVKVTLWPTREGFTLEVSATAVCSSTIWLQGDAPLSVEVLAAWDASPLYDTVIECAPTASVDVVNVAATGRVQRQPRGQRVLHSVKGVEEW